MKTTTISSTPPEISFGFSPDLLISALDRNKKTVETKIKPIAKKKLRDVDMGKRRLFIIILMKYNEEYERQKTQEKNYETKIKNSPKMSCLSSSSTTMRFTRFKD